MDVLTEKNDMETNAEKGAKLLDVRCPGWAWEVNILELDMADIFKCVLGQLYGTWDLGLTALGIPGDSEVHGFNLGDLSYVHTYEELDDVWVELILARRS
ncbi:hypothetical protein AB0C87_24790 [Actinomadura sp. NPDC048021]|uniref:hypothetical protein n=1 Tax=Actinomadura sp. NPDC048021 TaxID=3155385 RepID=UPI0033DA89A2